MKIRVLVLALLAGAAAWGTQPAEEPAPKSHMRGILKARAAEEAKKKSRPADSSATAQGTQKAGETPALPSTTSPATEPAANTTTGTNSTAAMPQASESEKPANETPTLLPKVEVRKDRITELDRQLHEQAKEIRREKKNTQQSETDKALNNSKVSKLLSIFGGESSEHRSAIAQERVALMEAESDLMEAIAHTKSKEEKQELEKQLDQLKALRRDLEKSLR